MRCGLLIVLALIACDGPSGVEPLAIKYVDHIAAGRLYDAQAMQSPTMQNVLPAAKLEEVWGEIIFRHGVFVRRLETRREPEFRATRIIVKVELERDRIDIAVVFDVNKAVAGLWFKPAGKSEHTPDAELRAGILERALTVGAKDWPLPATLTLPRGPGPFATVLLVHGSGPNDRDETLGPNKPFADIAHGLGTRGIATLRYEKRTREHAERLAENDTPITITNEVIDDAVASLEILAALPEIDRKRLFVLGHSLGGTLAPKIGEQRSVSGLIILAGATRPLEELILKQTLFLMRLEGISSEEKKEFRELEKRVARVKGHLTADTPTRKLPLGLPASYWLSLQQYDPVATAQRLAIPTLVLQGKQDYQVTMADFALWQQGLQTKQTVFKVYDGLNHLFMAADGAMGPQQYRQPGHVAEIVLDDIAAFVAAQR